MFDEIAQLFKVGRDAREEKEGNLVPLIHEWIQQQEDSDNEYRGSRLWALCPFKASLNSLFPESAREVRPPRLFIRNGIGTYTHLFLQNVVLARAGIIWGDWKCVYCGDLEKDSYWTELDHRSCGANPDSHHRWEYQEMEVTWKGADPFGEDILGHVDGIFFPNGKRTLLDIKTTTAKTFSYYLKEPSEDHTYQLNIYMGLDPGGAEQSVILYVNLENGEMKTFKIRKDPKVMEDAKAKIAARKEYYDVFGRYEQSFSEALARESKKGRNIFKHLGQRACLDSENKRARFCPQKNNCWNTPLIETVIKKRAKEATDKGGPRT